MGFEYNEAEHQPGPESFRGWIKWARWVRPPLPRFHFTNTILFVSEELPVSRR
jgi:hypothetical protein